MIEVRYALKLCDNATVSRQRIVIRSSPQYPQEKDLHKIAIPSYPLSVLVKDAQNKLEGKPTLKPTIPKRVRSSCSTAMWKGIRAVAEFTFWLDEMVGKIADQIFRELPSSWQLALERANDQFKLARNAALGVATLYNVPREKKAGFDLSPIDSNPSTIDSNPSTIDSNPSTIDSNPSTIDSNISSNNFNKPPVRANIWSSRLRNSLGYKSRSPLPRLADQRGDVPGWVLVVLMTTGLVTALWTIAAPRLSQILRNSLDSMNSIR